MEGMKIEDEELYFKLASGGDFLAIIPEKFRYSGQPEEWDDPIICRIVTKGGPFQGTLEMDLVVEDFEMLKEQFKYLYDHLDGKTSLIALSGLRIDIKGDNLGHFHASIKASNYVDLLPELSYSISFDQSFIPELILQLNRIVQQFTISKVVAKKKWYNRFLGDSKT